MQMSGKQSKLKLNCLRVHWTGIKRCAGNYFSLSSLWQIRQGVNKWIRKNVHVRVCMCARVCALRVCVSTFLCRPIHTPVCFLRLRGDNRMHNIASIFLMAFVLLLPVLSWWCVPSQPFFEIGMQGLFLLCNLTHIRQRYHEHAGLQTH